MCSYVVDHRLSLPAEGGAVLHYRCPIRADLQHERGAAFNLLLMSQQKLQWHLELEALL